MSLLDVQNISKTFVMGEGLWTPKRQVHAVKNVSFQIPSGEIVGLVGESGSGKTTVGRLVMGLLRPDSGKIFLEGRENLNRIERAKFVQMIFQDPYASLNPKLSVGTILEEAYNVGGRRGQQPGGLTPRHLGPHPGKGSDPNEETIKDYLNAVGLPTDILDSYPHQFSGGQRQRLTIARALLTRPKLLLADEPVSSLDITTGAQILELLVSLKDRFQLSYLFISHDLAVVSQLCDRVLVMKEGEVVESGLTQSVLSHPQNSYTKRLLNSVLSLPS